MTKSAQAKDDESHSEQVSRKDLIKLLNEDLAREYQAIIAYVVYSQVIKGAAYMNIAAELEKTCGRGTPACPDTCQSNRLPGWHADCFGRNEVKISEKAEDMLRFDLDNENETIRNYRQRVRQCEALGEYAIAEQIRKILVQEQEHQMDLATALGIDVPNVDK